MAVMGLMHLLTRLGARVTGIALPPASEPNLYALARMDELCDSHVVDIRDARAVAEVVEKFAPKLIVGAGGAHELRGRTGL